MNELVRRFLLLLALGIWLGGLTFYALVVIPAGQDVLRSHVKVGFITERVTTKLNWIGIAALAVLLWNIIATGGSAGPKLRTGLLGTWGVLTLLQVMLFFLHPALERLLDHQAREVLDELGFYGIHRVYLIVTTLQWSCALAHLALVLASWRKRDGRVNP